MNKKYLALGWGLIRLEGHFVAIKYQNYTGILSSGPLLAQRKCRVLVNSDLRYVAKCWELLVGLC